MDFKHEIAVLLSKQTGKKTEEIEPLLEVPPKGLGDYAYPCFQLAKEQKKSPIDISNAIKGTISADFIEKVESKGPYINFFLQKGTLSGVILDEVFSSKGFEKLGSGKVLVEYSSPNTNKPLHLGHLRNQALGLAISNLLECTGHKVIKANLVNDRGVHICKSMLAYQLFAKGKTPESENRKSDHFVGDMYVLFSKNAENDKSLEEKAQELLVKWEQGDKETIELWKKMNAWALDGMKQTYEKFGSKFDEWMFESEIFEKKLGKKIIEEGLEKKIFGEAENGAIIALLEPEMQNKVLLRGDGTSLYATNDLGLTQYKFDNYKIDKAIWVVGSEQEFYFKQLFKIFEKLGRPWAKNCFHLTYGMVNLTSGKMKSREGTVVDADNLIEEVQEIAKKEIDERYQKLSEKEKEIRSNAIALSAIKFYLLKNDAKKDMLFDPKQSISFDGETGPYLQYTYARAKSILRKAEKYSHKDFELLTHEKEKELLTELGNFNDSIKKSWESLSLHPLCHQLLSICEKFNSFYHDVPVLKSTKELNARLSLVEATAITIKKGLEILDIEAIEEM
jgi:arginyl-tRNA synthetase